MKIKSLLASLLVGAGLTASSLLADTVTVYQTGFDGGLDGGELLAVTSDNGSFLTFCLEPAQPIRTDFEYAYTKSNIVQNQNDPISKGTAWLYESFRNGTIPNYLDAHYTNAGLLQLAFWELEDDDNSYIVNGYVTLAINHFAGLGENAYDDYSGSNVFVMNPWGARQEDIQSLLALKSVPDSGVSIALLGLGMLSLAFIRRKL